MRFLFNICSFNGCTHRETATEVGGGRERERRERERERPKEE